MITEPHIQESLSRAYIHAVAGCAGVNCLIDARSFDYGIDGTFRPISIRGTRRVETGFPLDFQLKCTLNWSFEGDDVAYSIKTKTYNDLVTRDPDGVGVVLVLLCIPAEKEGWAEFTEESLTLRRCCYFNLLSGHPEENENSTKKILIPRTNVLDATSLQSLLNAERERKLVGGV